MVQKSSMRFRAVTAADVAEEETIVATAEPTVVGDVVETDEVAVDIAAVAMVSSEVAVVAAVIVVASGEDVAEARAPKLARPISAVQV